MHTCVEFTYEDDIENKNKYVAGTSRTICVSSETINRPPQSRETIPLNTKLKYIIYQLSEIQVLL
jgi:hypothetical protein